LPIFLSEIKEKCVNNW